MAPLVLLAAGCLEARPTTLAVAPTVISPSPVPLPSAIDPGPATTTTESLATGSEPAGVRLVRVDAGARAFAATPN